MLQKGAQVNLRDNDENTALDLAALAENDQIVELLEQHGAEKHTSKGVFESALEEQKLLKKEQPKTKAGKTMAKAKGAAGAMGQAMSAMRERGDRLERLDNKTAQLQSEAADYASMAKKLKEQNKKKASLFGR